MEPQFNECVNDKLGVPTALLKGLGKDENVININDDWDTPQTKELSQLLSQSVECEGRVLHSKTQYFELIDFAVPNKTKVLSMAGVDCDMIIC